MNEEAEIGADLVARFDKAMPVSVAFWAKVADASQWHLYIASDQLDPARIGDGYEVVQQLTVGNPVVDSFRVKLISSNDPLAVAALQVRRRYPGWPRPIRFSERLAGVSFVEEAYVYPELPAASPA